MKKPTFTQFILMAAAFVFICQMLSTSITVTENAEAIKEIRKDVEVIQDDISEMKADIRKLLKASGAAYGIPQDVEEVETSSDIQGRGVRFLMRKLGGKHGETE